MASNNLAMRIVIGAVDNASSVFKKITSSWGALVAAIGGGALFGSSVNEAADFEQAIANVGAVANASADDLARMSEQARELGATTSWSASEVAEGMRYLSMAGFDVNETLAAMPGMLNLASAGAVDLGEAADIASNILSGFALEASEMGRVGDVLTNTFTSSNTTLQSLGETMKYVAPAAAAAGISIEEAAAMAGKLGDAGIQGSDAGTALRGMFIRLAAPPKMAADALKDFGISATDGQGKLRPMIDVLAELDVELNKLGSGDKIGAASKIFGVEAASAGLVLTAQAASGALGEMAESVARQGAAAEVAEKQNATFWGAMKTLGSALSEIKIAFGERFLDPFTEQIRAAAASIVEFSKSPAFAKIRQAFVDTFSAAAEYVRQFFAEFDWDTFANSVANAAQNVAESIKNLGNTLEAGRKTALFFIASWQALATGFATIEAAFYGFAGVIASVMSKLVELSATGARGVLAALGPIGQAILGVTDVLQKAAGVDLGAVSASLAASAEANFQRAGKAIDDATERGRNFQATVADLNRTAADTSGIDKTGQSAKTAASEIESASARMEAALNATYDPANTAEAKALSAATAAYAKAVQSVGQAGGASATEVERLRQKMEETGTAYNDRVADMERYRAQAQAIKTANFEMGIAQRDYQAALKQSASGDIEAGQRLGKLGDALQKAKDKHDGLTLALKREMGLSLSTDELDRYIQLTGDATDATNALKQAQEQPTGSTVSLEQAKAMFNEITRLQDAYGDLKAAGDDIGAARVMAQLKQLQAEYAATDQSAGDSISQIIQDVGQLETEYTSLRGQAQDLWDSGQSAQPMADAFAEMRERARELSDELQQVDTSQLSDQEMVAHVRAMQALFQVTRDDAQGYAGALSAVEQAGNSLTNTVSADNMKGLLSREGIKDAWSNMDQLTQAYQDGAISLDDLKEKGAEALNTVTSLSEGAKQPLKLDADTTEADTKIKTMYDELRKLSEQPFVLKFGVDDADVAPAIEALKSIIDADTKIGIDTSQAESALQELEARLSALQNDGSATVSVTADTAEAENKITAVAEYTPPAMTVPVTADTAEAQALLDALQTPTASVHSVDPDTAAAESAIKALQKDTSSTHTIRVRKVETNATGGLVGAAVLRRASGGGIFKPLSGTTVPGSGDRDTVPRALPAGSFVIRKAASRAYAPLIDTLLTPGERVIPPRLVRSHPGFWQALNDMDIPRFNTGGAVGGAPAAATTASNARDSIDINLQIGGRRVQVQGARDQANALAGALRALSRGA